MTMVFIDQGFSFNPLEQDILMRERMQADEQEPEGAELVIYETVDVAAILEYELGHIPDKSTRFSQLHENVHHQISTDKRSLILVPLQDNAYYAVMLDGCRYPLSRLPQRYDFDEKYGIVPPDEEGILLEGFFRKPTVAEIDEGFEQPVFMSSPVDLTLSVEPNSRWNEYLNPDASAFGKYIDHFRKDEPLLMRQAATATQTLPSIGFFIANSAHEILAS